jgi:acetyl-CoA carboxylase biotin carboxylase subunit
VRTTIPFARRVLRDAAFRAGRHTTALVDRLLAAPTAGTEPARPADPARPAPEPDIRADADPAGRTPVTAVPAAGPTAWRNP